MTAAHRINHTPTQIHKGKIPYELLFGAAPSYYQLRVLVFCAIFIIGWTKTNLVVVVANAFLLVILLVKKVGEYIT